MAEKTLNTRIKLKYDTYTNWSEKNPALKAGEFAATYVGNQCNINSDNKTLTNSTSGTIPAGSILLKVGNANESNYNALPFVSAIPATIPTDSVDIPYVVCDTAGDAQDKGLTIDNFMLSDGTKIVVKFTNTNTANNPYFVIPTDTVTTYRYPICYRGSAIPSNALVANGTYTFVYNGTQWEFVGDIATSSRATTSADGLMSADDKKKLDGIASNANNYSLPAAGSSLGGVKTGGDVTISSGIITVNDDSHNHVISNVDGLQTALDGKANKTTYEYNKELSAGSSGKVCIGKFPCYDSNITVNISSTTNVTYNGTLVIATQNINTTAGGNYKATVYGDATNTLCNLIKIGYGSGSRNFSVYIDLPPWSKNLLHIQCVGLYDDPTSIATSVTSIPSTATITPTNALDNIANNNKMTGYSKPSSTSAISPSDTLNSAIGKLEKALDGVADLLASI